MVTKAKQVKSEDTSASVFDSLVTAGSDFGSYTIERESENIGDIDFVSFSQPTQVLVSRWYPGYRVTDLTGSNAEEAVAVLLGDSISTIDHLEGFRRVLASPGIAASVITTLLPRANIVVRDRNYVVSDDMISSATRQALIARGAVVDSAVLTAYTHAITRVLAAKGLAAPGLERRVVKVANSFAITADDLRRVILVEAMRDIFSESRIQTAVKSLDENATPQILGEKIGEMFRQFSFSIPEIKLRLEQFDISITMIKMFNLDPVAVPISLQAHQALGDLASIANFMVYDHVHSIEAIRAPGAAVAEIKEALNSMQTLIASAPSIEVITLSKFAEYFGEVPISSPDGIRRGLVMYSVRGQTSKMEIADVVPKGDEQSPDGNGYAMSLVDPSYVRSSGLAGPLNGSLLTTNAMAGLANIVADEYALLPIEMKSDCSFDPRLLTIQVSEADVTFLALARATSVAYVRTELPAGPGTPLSLLFGCTVAEQWRTSVFASTPALAFFLDPAAVLVYTSKMVALEPKTLPARAQSIGLAMSRDVRYLGSIEHHLRKEVEQTYIVKVTVAPYGGEPVLLQLKINVLGALVGYDVDTLDRGGAYYAAVAEPGVDEELDNMLKLALAYASLPISNIHGDKAKSWLVVHLAPLMLHPSVRIIAERAVNSAVLKERLDARRLAPQMREAYNHAFFGTTLAILNRFGKVSGAVATGLSDVIPAQTLSLQAAMTLAQLPAAINGAASLRRQ